MTSPLTIALAQFRPRKGRFAENLARLGPLFAAFDAPDAIGPRVLQLPETALTGYFLEGGVRDAARTAGTMARELDETYRGAVPAAQAPLFFSTQAAKASSSRSQEMSGPGYSQMVVSGGPICGSIW